MFKVPHRHIVLSAASEFWPYFQKDWDLLKTYQDCAISALNDYLPKYCGTDIRVGAIVILHTFGKDLVFKPHLHLIMTEGGFTPSGKFVPKTFFPAEKFEKVWRYHVCKKLCSAGIPFSITNWCYKNKRFYVWVHKDGRISHPKVIAKYLGRYVRHPAIANSRIDLFDKQLLRVGFHYFDHANIRHDILMKSDDFISALIGHIPPKQFKLIRYYGAYSRRSKRKFKSYLQSSIEQQTLLQYGVESPELIQLCPFCHGPLEFIAYFKKPPPKIQRDLFDFIPISLA
jgi:hypothetical protein